MHLQQIMDYAVPNYRCLAPNLGTGIIFMNDLETKDFLLGMKGKRVSFKQHWFIDCFASLSDFLTCPFAWPVFPAE